MRALRMAFAAAFPFEIRPFNRARSSSLSLTTNFLFATAIPLVGSIRQNKNQYSRRNATSLFKWCIPLAAPTTMGIATSIVLRAVAIVGNWVAIVGSCIAVVIVIRWVVAAAVVRGRDSAANQSAGKCARWETPSTMPAAPATMPTAPAAVPSAETHLDQITLLRHRLGG